MDLVPRKSFFRDIFDDLFEAPLVKAVDIMKSDIYEHNNHYVIEIDIPGFKKEDISIDYDKGYLTITAKKEEKIDEHKNYIRKERFYGQYKRSFYIGDVDESKIDAKFEDGILKVIFPKEQLESPDKKKITIK